MAVDIPNRMSHDVGERESQIACVPDVSLQQTIKRVAVHIAIGARVGSQRTVDSEYVIDLACLIKITDRVAVAQRVDVIL